MNKLDNKIGIFYDGMFYEWFYSELFVKLDLFLFQVNTERLNIADFESYEHAVIFSFSFSFSFLLKGHHNILF
ncbi:MAG TPA: hypothetical protein VI278_16720 [Nitrososphaeraceae archaeon]